MSRKLTALVTGGSRGIGRSIVMRFAAAGYGCIFTYRSGRREAEELIAVVKKHHPKVMVEALQLDIRNAEGIDGAVQELLERHDNIQVLVNNAGILRNKSAVLMSNEEWQEVIDTNLSGAFYMTRALLMHFISNRFGRIINILSLAVQGSSGQVNYAASKGGLESVTYTLAREYGAKNITTNGVTAGLVATDMTSGEAAVPLKELWEQYCPMGRLPTAEEVANAVYFFTSPEADYINGEVLKVTGGFNHAPY